MVIPTIPILNHPDNIPTRFGPLKIIAHGGQRAHLYNKIHRETIPKNCSTASGNIVVPTATPVLSMSNLAKNMYQANDFAQIKTFESLVQRDLLPVYQNIIKNGEKAWVCVETTSGVQLYMSWSSSGAIYAYCTSIIPSFNMAHVLDPNAKFVGSVQLGIYSSSANVVGTHTLTFGLPHLVLRSSLALAVAETYGSFFGNGLNFKASQFAIRLNQAASKLGLGTYFTVPQYALGQLVESLTFSIVFLGVNGLVDESKGRTRVQLFNWDGQHQWQFTVQKMVNTYYPGLENPHILAIDTNKNKFKPLPLDFTFDTSVPYTVLVYQKGDQDESQFAIQAIRSNVAEGFTYGFNRSTTQTSQYMEGTVSLPTTFLSSVGTKWQSTPMGLVVKATTQQIPVSAVMDSNTVTKPNQLSNVNIHINKLTGVKSLY